MTEGHERVINIVCEELKARKDVMGIILFGSLATGDFHKYSDVDLYVVVNQKTDKVSCFVKEGITVQIQWRGLIDFKEKIMKQTRNKPVSLTGKILYDPSGIIEKHLKKSAEFLENKGPKPMSEEEKLMVQISLSGDIKTVKGLLEKGNQAGAVLLMNDLLLQALDVFYDHRGWWNPGKKRVIGDLKKRDYTLGCTAEKVILSNSLDERLKSLIKVRNIVLEILGGSKEEYEIGF